MKIKNASSFIKFVVNFLIENRLQYDKEYIFDFPDYGGLPKNIWNRLPSDLVDVIQIAWSELQRGNTEKFKETVDEYVREWQIKKSMFLEV
jgi:hypothetical protein